MKISVGRKMKRKQNGVAAMAAWRRKKAASIEAWRRRKKMAAWRKQSIMKKENGSVEGEIIGNGRSESSMSA
jgi:hypothetical protein